MSIRVEFDGGPADGAVTEYAGLEFPLPSLYWQGEEPYLAVAVYHRATDAPDPDTGTWRYRLAKHRQRTPDSAGQHDPGTA